MVSTSKTCINLTWTPPEDDRGVPVNGYLIEKRKKDTAEWIALNTANEPIEGLQKTYIHIIYLDLFFFSLQHSSLFLDLKYAVKEVTEGAQYQFRVSAINESGSGEPSPQSAMACAKNPNSEYWSELPLFAHINVC